MPLPLIQNASIPQQHHRPKGEETRKRKRNETVEEAIELDRRPFTVRPDVSEPFAAPRSFTPVCLLPRARLPLAYLDTSAGSNRCFSAHIRVLELLEDVPSVLIAECEKESRLYAVEWAQERTYALCRLAQWVKRDELEQAANAVARREEEPVKRRAVQTVEHGKPWWSRAAVEMPSSSDATVGDANAPKIAMKAPAALVDDTAHELPVDTVGPGPDAPRGVLPEQPSSAEPTNATDVLQELAKQYQDALYLARTPLAYFTKGPLSRARAAFSCPGSALEIIELTTFLRDAILTASVTDKKYKDAISDVVKELSPIGLETPEQVTKPKKKRKWKSKRDKFGLFADEKDYIARWWRLHDEHHDGVPPSAETIETALKRRLPRIRSRETYMQVILVLEVLALEAAVPSSVVVGATLALTAESQDPETQQDESQAPKDAKKTRPKKQQDLPALLEGLLDRLCIWKELYAPSPVKKFVGDKDSSSDELQSFCIEVIIPFYMSRCPQYATIVNKKLGGPTAPTPVKRKSTSTRKPGEPATRQAPEQKARKPLSRVATETSVGRVPPSLHRSATDSQLLQQQIKRENSETPSLNNIPRAPPQRRERSGLMPSSSFSNRMPREVDFSAMSQANLARAKKKAEMERSIRDAVDTLKKPNRALATKETAESADASFAKATAKRQPAKAKPPVRVAATPAKHVKATPVERRERAAEERSSGVRSTVSRVPATYARVLDRQPAQPADEQPPSSAFVVPQTGHRPRHTAPSSRAVGVEDTPSRGFAKFMPPSLVHAPGTLDSPTATRHAHIAATPVKPVRSLSLVPLATEALVEASPNAVGRTMHPPTLLTTTDKGGEGGIYSALGWDDDDDYEPLA